MIRWSNLTNRTKTTTLGWASLIMTLQSELTASFLWDEIYDWLDWQMSKERENFIVGRTALNRRWSDGELVTPQEHKKLCCAVDGGNEWQRRLYVRCPYDFLSGPHETVEWYFKFGLFRPRAIRWWSTPYSSDRPSMKGNIKAVTANFTLLKVSIVFISALKIGCWDVWKENRIHPYRARMVFSSYTVPSDDD